MKHFSSFVIAALVLAGIGLTSCNDLPSTPGSSFITDTLTTVILSSADTTLITKAYTGPVQVAMTNGGDKASTNIFLLGQTPTAKSTVFIRFNLVPDSVNTLQETEIISASLKLQPLKYTFGDTVSNQLKFTVSKINTVWTPAATTDTLLKGNFLGEQLQSFSGTIPLGDSVNPVRIPLPDKASLHHWLYVDSAKYGFALTPDAGSTVIRQFSLIGIGEVSRASAAIELVYKRSGSDKIDTVDIPSAFVNTFVESLAPVPDEHLLVQSGALYRSHLFFDMSMIPALATIHKAELVLPWDPTTSLLGTSGAPATLNAYFATDTTLLSTDGSHAVGTRRTDVNEYLFPNIGSAIERWMREGRNNGLILYMPVSSELREVTRLSLYGVNHPDSTKRPRLTIIYSTKPAKQ
jgi:hypothetical protein